MQKPCTLVLLIFASTFLLAQQEAFKSLKTFHVATELNGNGFSRIAGAGYLWSNRHLISAEGCYRTIFAFQNLGGRVNYLWFLTPIHKHRITTFLETSVSYVTESLIPSYSNFYQWDYSKVQYLYHHAGIGVQYRDQWFVTFAQAHITYLHLLLPLVLHHESPDKQD